MAAQGGDRQGDFPALSSWDGRGQVSVGPCPGLWSRTAGMGGLPANTERVGRLGAPRLEKDSPLQSFPEVWAAVSGEVEGRDAAVWGAIRETQQTETL